MNCWSEYSHVEVMDMYGAIEADDENDFESDEEATMGDDDPSCPKCSGSGCNYCYMTDY